MPSELAILAALVAAGVALGRPAPPVVDDKMPMTERRKRFRCAVAAAGLGDDWLRFLETTALRESRFSPTAWNQTPSEVKAAARAVKARRDTLVSLGLRPDEWAFGSKGLFQFLGPYVALKSNRLRFPLENTNPDMAFDPGVAVATAFDFARGLMGWKNFPGTWAGLRVGWGLPGKMGDPKRLKEKGASMEARAAKLGWAPGWAHEKIKTRPPKRDPQQILNLARAAALAWEGCI